MKLNIYLLIAACHFLLLSGCANPINQATADRYSQTCSTAMQDGRLELAEEACRRALINVDMGHLGDKERSQKLYNYAMTKKRLAKFEEAGDLYIQALEIEERQEKPSNEKIGRRLAEIAVVYWGQGRFEEGLPYVERLLPLADQYIGNERKTIATLLGNYADALKETSRHNTTISKLSQKAIQMGFTSNDLRK